MARYPMRRVKADMRHVLILLVVGALALALAVSGPTRSLGQDAEREPEGVGPEREPTATAIVSTPAATPEPSGSITSAATPALIATRTQERDRDSRGDRRNSRDKKGGKDRDRRTKDRSSRPAEVRRPGQADHAMRNPEGEGPERVPVTIRSTPAPGPAGTPSPAPMPASIPPTATLAPDIGSSAERQATLIAQGVAELPIDELVWRTVRYQAESIPQAPFDERPRGFVIATEASLLLVDEASGEPTLLTPGEAVFVRAGAVQQRASLTDEPTHYVAIELVSAETMPETLNGTMLHTSAPFAPSPGRKGLYLVRHVLTPGTVFEVPDTDERNILHVIEGAVVVRPSQSDLTATLVGGESTVFRGVVELSSAETEGAESADMGGATVVVGLIGSDTTPPTVPTPRAAVAP